MARIKTTVLVDDIDGTSEAQEAISFGIDGASYEIHLTHSRAAELRETLAEYVAVARRVSGSKRAGRKISTTTSDRNEMRKVREWAEAEGWDVGSRGRIRKEIVDEYRAKHK